jgi:hypothetical protein
MGAVRAGAGAEGRGPDPLGHQLHVRQGGRLGQTAGTRGGPRAHRRCCRPEINFDFLAKQDNLVRFGHIILGRFLPWSPA